MFECIVLIIAVGVCALTVFFCRLYNGKVYDSIDGVLERILLKDTALRLETTGEDRLSKLKHKAARVVEMCRAEADMTKTEKETIQGFISDMSHQMKTPLAGIIMYADLLAACNADEHARAPSAPDAAPVSVGEEFCQRIKSSAEKLQWMTECLIKLSRLEAGAITLSPAPSGIHQTIMDAIDSVTALAYAKKVNIRLHGFEDCRLYHDRKWTREVITNVLENAVKYSGEDGSVEITLEQLALYTKVIITDHGIGIDKADWNLIFKRFYRGRNVQDKAGVGLGLYLAALVMEKQSGYIMVDSIPGKYAAFSLFLQNCKK